MYKLINKKGFTLVEMMVVVVLLGLILAMTMSLGAKNITKLNEQNIKDDFVDSFNNLYSNSLSSNYHKNKIFNDLNIDFLSGGTGFKYFYTLEDTVKNLPSIYGYESKLDEILLYNFNVLLENDSTSPTNYIRIKIIPYEMGCKIFDSNNNTGINLKFNAKIKKSSDYCFNISADNCRLKQESCSP